MQALPWPRHSPALVLCHASHIQEQHLQSTSGTPWPNTPCLCCGASTQRGWITSTSAPPGSSWCQWEWTPSTPSLSGVGRKVKGAGWLSRWEARLWCVLGSDLDGPHSKGHRRHCCRVSWNRRSPEPGEAADRIPGLCGQGSAGLASGRPGSTLGKCPLCWQPSSSERSPHPPPFPSSLPSPDVLVLSIPSMTSRYRTALSPWLPHSRNWGRILPPWAQKHFFFFLTF